MPARTCPITGDQLTPGRTISTRALATYRHSLISLETLMWDLNIELTRQAKHGPAVRNGSRCTAMPLPYSDSAAEAAWVVRQTVFTWVDELARRRGETTPTTWEAIGRWLRNTSAWLATQYDGPQVVDEIMYAIDLATRATDPTRVRTLRVGLSCQSLTDNGSPCEGQYTASVWEQQNQLPDLVCDRDDTHRVEPSQWQRCLRRARDPRGAASLVSAIRHAHPGAA